MANEWTDYLILTLDSAIDCNKIRYYIHFPYGYPYYYLSHVIMDIKKDGSWVNIMDDISGGWINGAWAEIEFSEGSVDAWRVKIQAGTNYLTGNVYEFDFWQISGDATPPTYSNIGTNASCCSEVCKFSCLWQDETNLSGHIFGWNGTGIFQNDSWTSFSGASAWANVSKTLPSFACQVTFQWWCNDTSNNWNTTGLQTLNVTSEAPPYVPPHWLTFTLTVYTTLNGEPCPLNVTVERHKTLLSDDNGTVKFSLPMGNYVVFVSWGDQTQNRTINIDRDLTVTFDFRVTNWVEFLLRLVGALIVCGLVLWMYPDLLPKKRREKPRKHKDNLQSREHENNLKERGHKNNLKERGHKSTVKPRKHKR